jgi:hypothetical protein
MKMKCVRVAVWMAGLILFFLAPLSVSSAEVKSLIVVAGKVNYDTARSWVNFLEKEGISVKHVSASEFAAYKSTKYLVVIGSPDEGGGIGEILKEALTAKELAWLREEGNNRMYLKDDVWAKGQSIIVFAGHNQRGAELARLDSKEEWWLQIAGWFDVELDPRAIYGY